MFRKRKNKPQPGIEKILPELVEFVRKRYRPEKKQTPLQEKKPLPKEKPAAPPAPEKVQSPGSESQYEVPIPTGRVQYSFNSGAAQPDRDDAAALLRRAQKDPSLLDSAEFMRFYHEWERDNAEKTSFSAEVVRQVNREFKKASAFYLAAGIDKRIYHRMKTDYSYKPSKNTAIRCCLGLQLNAELSERLLKLAGYAFSPSDPSDLIILFCLDHGIWDLPSVNYLMDSFDLKDLEGYAAV